MSEAWTDEEWRLPLSPSLLEQASGEGLSAADARAAIQQRIMAMFSANSGNPLARARDGAANQEFAHAVATQIVRSLDATANLDGQEGGRIDGGIVGALDLRPYIDMIAANPERTIKIERYGSDTTREMSSYRQAEIAAALATTADEIGASVGGGDVAYSMTEVGLSPEARVAALNANPAAAANQSTVQDAVFGGDVTRFDEVYNTPMWNEQDAINAANLPSTFLDTAIAYEADFNEQAGTPGQQRGGVILEQGGGYQGVGKPNKMLSYAAAASYLNNLSVPELIEMQSKLAKAGYYDKVGAQYVAGDHDDQATMQAWDALLRDAWTSKTGIDKVLINNARTARERKQQEAMARWGTTDTSRAAIEQAAVEILGRSLDADEFARVRDTIMSLKQERADDLVGVDSMSWYNEQTAAQGWDTNDVNDRIMREFGGEIAIQNSQDVRQKLKDVYNYSVEDDGSFGPGAGSGPVAAAGGSDRPFVPSTDGEFAGARGGAMSGAPAIAAPRKPRPTMPDWNTANGSGPNPNGNVKPGDN